MESLSSKNTVVKYLLLAIDVFINFASVNPLTNKKTKIVLNGFIGIVNQSKRKPNKLWVVKEENFIITLCKMLR